MAEEDDPRRSNGHDEGQAPGVVDGPERNLMNGTPRAVGA